MSEPREGEEFPLNVPEKLDNPFPELEYFREHRPVFYYPPLQTWCIFRYDDVTALFQDARLSADRMKGFVDAAPAEVRDELRALGDDERWTRSCPAAAVSQPRVECHRFRMQSVLISLEPRADM